ncbi:TonB-dependent receptor family protein [Pseudoduganella violacea]|uniref:Iron complex outermembrane receptor protein n=1 Tax=Pseudoduganella violacea TaxID=1715466 RepID=A0A7W5BFV2_9BURK|nr:TonB-dependent receptor [Pseudoduganella violacea]MBB3122427.1 iron complex outermembrane receptor protein [Pseudoduganella violacea]
MPYKLRRIAFVSACSALPWAAAAQEAAPTLADIVVVSGSRAEHISFGLPAAIDVIDAARIRDVQLRVNVSEALIAVPGLTALNRQNYAQDLQISSRGFGARSAFGVRGVRLIADGIPASMPDGQGQAATFNLDRAQRIEVLRGPYSALYGNHAGGVIQLFTADGKGPPSIEFSAMGGSNGTNKANMSAQGESAGLGYVLDASRFRTDGYRAHSAARRDQQYAKLTMAPTEGGKLTIVANGLQQHDTQDPLGVQWASLQRDPRAGEIDLSDTASHRRSYAERYNTRKSIDHYQLGASYDQRIGNGRLHATIYGGNRRVIQFQAFSRAFQVPASHSGGVIDFKRDFYGAALNWAWMQPLAGGRLHTTLGIELDRSEDERTGYENFIGSQTGLRGALRRNETDTVSSVDPYIQMEWQRGAWVWSAGLRHSRIKVAVNDHYLSNGNDSGQLSYRRSTPTFGLLYKLTPALNLYASTARGFETPTLNELFYSGTGGGFNYQLRAAGSTHVEAGLKAINQNTRLDAALFQVWTDDELTVDAANGGRTSYRNASKTLRRGAEVSFTASWAHGFNTRLALTALHAVYAQAYGNVRQGSRLPGVASGQAYAELAWTADKGRFGAALETFASSKLFVEDSNAEQPAPGYTITNLRLTAAQSAGGWRLKQFIRLNNLADRRYAGSVIVGDSNKRYYEAAPQRNWAAGISAQLQF